MRLKQLSSPSILALEQRRLMKKKDDEKEPEVSELSDEELEAIVGGIGPIFGLGPGRMRRRVVEYGSLVGGLDPSIIYGSTP